MAKLRPRVSPATAEPRLNRRGVDEWLTTADCDSLSALLGAAASEPDIGKKWALRRSAYGLYERSWGFGGDIEELLLMWAEERRQRACLEWVRAEGGRSLDEFQPFGCDTFGYL